jgi:hypothetical protein
MELHELVDEVKLCRVYVVKIEDLFLLILDHSAIETGVVTEKLLLNLILNPILRPDEG